MALNWNWSNKCGELTLRKQLTGKEPREITLHLYQGNAVLIMLNEYKTDGGEDEYAMYSFFVDKQHMKNCLGLTKGHTNIFDDESQTFTKLRLNRAKNRYWKDIVTCFAEAFENLVIEVYNDPA